ncbi:MAG: class II aldolase/adducin family protein [Candidatus Omnitrophota bacterium]
MSFEKEKKELIYWSKALSQRGLATAKNGNVSYKLDNGNILLTAHDSYLGYLEDSDIILTDTEGNILEGQPGITAEKSMHLNIQSKFKDTKVVLHAHPTHTTAFFHYFDRLEIFSFEAKFYLGDIQAIPQETPAVTEMKPVISALERSNIVVLKNHGVVSMGKDFKEAFSLIELLEEQAKVNLLLNRQQAKDLKPSTENSVNKVRENNVMKYKVFSKEHVDRLVELINDDKEAQDLGAKHDLTCTLAVKDQDSESAMRFCYEKGRIVKADNSDMAEFVIIGQIDILKKVFNREINPFVALTQGKVKAKGDFSKMSKWYSVMVRTFKLWEQAPVE